MRRSTWAVGGVAVAVLLGCSGMFGNEAEPPPPEPEQPLAIGVEESPVPGGLPSTASWRELRLQSIRLGIRGPADWSVTDTTSTITATTPTGGIAQIVSSTTCGAQIEAKRGPVTPVFDEPGRFVYRTPPGSDGSTRCGVIAGRTLGDHVWCATVDETQPHPMTEEECLSVAAMVDTIEEPPGKGGGGGGGGGHGGGKKGSKRPQ